MHNVNGVILLSVSSLWAHYTCMHASVSPKLHGSSFLAALLDKCYEEWACYDEVSDNQLQTCCEEVTTKLLPWILASERSVNEP